MEACEYRTSMKRCLAMENEPVHSRDHTVTPHTDLSPVLGATNPLDQSTEIADLRTLIQATFQADANTNCGAPLPAIVKNTV